MCLQSRVGRTVTFALRHEAVVEQNQQRLCGGSEVAKELRNADHFSTLKNTCQALLLAL